MKHKTLGGSELAVWAIWLGALWFLAIVVVPALFKWLPRPEAGLVAGRLFYLMAWFSALAAGLLLILAILQRKLTEQKVFVGLMALVILVAVAELSWLNPLMQSMRQEMSSADAGQVQALREKFGTIHSVSSILYASKMIAGLVAGLLVFKPIAKAKENS
ncbi:MAG: DUF4149 domain-containing protein [Limnobacter sp.]|nr:DUF4149 domain-containing protein [Limnobacter sp.]